MDIIPWLHVSGKPLYTIRGKGGNGSDNVEGAQAIIGNTRYRIA